MGVRPFSASPVTDELTPEDIFQMAFGPNANPNFFPGRRFNPSAGNPNRATATHFHIPITPPIIRTPFFTEERVCRIKYGCKKLAFLAAKVALTVFGALSLFVIGLGIYELNLRYIMWGLYGTITALNMSFTVWTASAALEREENLRRTPPQASQPRHLATRLERTSEFRAPRIPPATFTQDTDLINALLASLRPTSSTPIDRVAEDRVADVNFVTEALWQYRNQLPISNEQLGESVITQTMFTENLTLEGIIQAPYIVLFAAIEQNTVPNCFNFIKKELEALSGQYKALSEKHKDLPEEKKHFKKIKKCFLANLVKDLEANEYLINPRDQSSAAAFLHSVQKLQKDFIRYPGAMNAVFQESYKQLGVPF